MDIKKSNKAINKLLGSIFSTLITKKNEAVKKEEAIKAIEEVKKEAIEEVIEETPNNGLEIREINNGEPIVIDGVIQGQDIKIVGEKVKSYNAITMRGAIVEDTKLVGDKKINDGEGYNGIVIEAGENEVSNNDISNFGGYGVVTSVGKSSISMYDIIDEDGKVVHGVSCKNLEKLDDNNIHLIKRINVEKIKQFELGYTQGYMGYNYCNGRNYVAKFFNAKDEVIAEIKSVQFDKVIVPEGAKLVDFIIEQNYIPQSGNADFNNAVLFITDFDNPKAIIKENYIHDNTRENIAICGGQGVEVSNNRLENTWIAIVIEDGWELCKDVVIKNNDFKGNGRDVIAASGRNLTFENNNFSNWVNIGNRVEGLKFNNNKLEATESDHTACNDRFVVEMHKGDVEICNNKFVNARVQLSADDFAMAGNVKVIAKGNVFENTHITASPEIVVFEDSKYVGGKDMMIVGNFLNSEITGKSVGFSGINLDKCCLHDVKVQCQKTNIVENSEVKNVHVTIFNGYKGASLEIKNSKLNNVKFEIAGRDKQDVFIVVRDSEITLSDAMLNFWNVSGVGRIEFVNCNIIAEKEIEYLSKTSWKEANNQEFQIIFDNCKMDSKIKNIFNNKIKEYVIVK